MTIWILAGKSMATSKLTDTSKHFQRKRFHSIHALKVGPYNNKVSSNVLCSNSTLELGFHYQKTKQTKPIPVSSEFVLIHCANYHTFANSNPLKPSDTWGMPKISVFPWLVFYKKEIMFSPFKISCLWRKQFERPLLDCIWDDRNI